jgi:hypothetical protein
MQARKVKSTLNNDGRPITAMTMSQRFKAVPGGNSVCPKKATLSASWSLTTTLPGNAQPLPVALLP